MQGGAGRAAGMALHAPLFRRATLLVLLLAMLSLAAAQDAPSEDSEVEVLRAQLREVQARADAAEQEVESLRDQSVRLTEKDEELQLALAEQQRAAREVQSETERAETLSAAKADLEGRVTDLHLKIAAAEEGGAGKVAAMEEELGRLKEKLGRERQSERTVIKLRQEKAALAAELAEAKNNMFATISGSAVEQASIAAAALQEQLKHAEGALHRHMEDLGERVGDAYVKAQPHLEKASETTRHYAKMADPAVSWSKQAATVLLARTRYPVAWLRTGVKYAALSQPPLAPYADDLAGASEYWVALVPVLLSCVLWTLSAASGGARHFGKQAQQAILLSSLLLALFAFSRGSTPEELLETFPPSLRAVGAAVGVALLTGAAVGYAVALVLGPRRLAAIVQLAGALWVLFALHRHVGGGPSSKGSEGFMTAHLMRSAASLAAAYGL